MSEHDVLNLSKELIACQSITPDSAGSLDKIAKLLTKYGFECNTIFFGEGNNRTENLYASLGKKNKNLCFAGHVDVVPVGNESAWTFPPFEATEHNGMLYGRGTSDMKVAIACFISATIDYINSHPDFTDSISFILTSDEEGDALYGTKLMVDWLKKQNIPLSACIVGEPSTPSHIGERIKIGRRGSLPSKLTIKGTQGHVAYPHMALNPVRILVDIAHYFQSTPLDNGSDNFQASNLEITSIDVDNMVSNLIPDIATMRFSIRFNDLHNENKLIAWLNDGIKKVLQKYPGAEYEMNHHINAPCYITKDQKFIDLVAEAVKNVTGTLPKLTTDGATSDGRFIIQLCPVIELGMPEESAHKVDEHVAIESIYKLKNIYKNILQSFFDY